MKITLATFLAAGLLAACGDNSDDEVTDIDTPEDNEEELQDEDNDTDDLEEDSEEENETEEETDSNDGASEGSGSYEDQEDLSIGDTAFLGSTTGDFEMTLNNVEIMDELDGEPSALDVLVLIDMTITNTGSQSFNSYDTANILRLSNTEDGGGSSQFEHDKVDLFNGDIEPGETMEGQLIFDASDSDSYYLKVNSGLIAAGAVYNEATWTFDESEAE